MNVLFCLIMSLFSLPGFSQEEMFPRGLENKLHAKQKELLKIQQEMITLGHQEMGAKALMDEKVVKLIQRLFQLNIFKDMPESDVKNLILQKTSRSAVGKLISKPKVLNCVVEILRDEKALPSAVGVLLRKKDLKWYGIISLCFILFSGFFKGLFIKKSWSFVGKFIFSVFFAVSVSVVSLSVFYFIFQQELSPVTKIIIKHVRKRNL